MRRREGTEDWLEEGDGGVMPTTPLPLSTAAAAGEAFTLHRCVGTAFKKERRGGESCSGINKDDAIEEEKKLCLMRRRLCNQ